MQTAPSANGNRYLIAGIDTGKTAALAVLDLDGNVVHTASERHGGLEWFVKTINSRGTPVIVATDKAKADTTVSKIAAAFDSVLFTPNMDISVKRKNLIGSGAAVGSTHERDALSAATFAYNAYRNKLDQADRLARQSNFKDRQKLKAMVIRKYSIHDILTDTKSGRRLVR